ncbi:hypothetical protein BC941DRAFT_517648 [Chlamydoabsidia padenii]|nr:hypothetical protein BC941DRAFT_517648 [Chlamydoabsidia padenii]
MVLIQSAVNLLNQRITGVVNDYDTICPVTRIMPRRDWVLFLRRESQRTSSTYYNVTSGSRVTKNKNFLEQFVSTMGLTRTLDNEKTSRYQSRGQPHLYSTSSSPPHHQPAGYVGLIQ